MYLDFCPFAPTCRYGTFPQAPIPMGKRKASEMADESEKEEVNKVLKVDGKSLSISFLSLRSLASYQLREFRQSILLKIYAYAEERDLFADLCN